MALRFLADHCISNPIVQTLRDATHEVVRLKDVLPVESPDATVIAKAQEIDAILLSMNGDFADIVTYPPKNYKGIVALQMRNHPEGEWGQTESSPTLKSPIVTSQTSLVKQVLENVPSVPDIVPDIVTSS
jgi:predicted nuclease of predicted toxin-antitoxin system